MEGNVTKGSALQNRAIKYGRLLMRATESLTAVLLVAVVLMNLAQVFFRYVLVDPISWSEETMRYTTTWMVMLAAAPALLRREHMVVSLFESSASPVLRRGSNVVVYLLVIGFCALLMWQGYPAAIDNMRQVSPAVRIPMAIPYMAIPVGATLILIDALFMLMLPQNALLAPPEKDTSS